MAMSASFSLGIAFLPSFTFESIRRHDPNVKEQSRIHFPHHQGERLRHYPSAGILPKS